MSQYLLKIQRAISETEDTCPSQDIEYQIGWGELTPDLAYAMGLGETATRQHLDTWTESVVDNDEDLGYYQRVLEIKKILRFINES